MKVSEHVEGGFLYLGLLFAVALLGLGLTTAASLERGALQRDRERELLSIGRQFVFAIGSYHRAAGGQGTTRYPPSLDDLLKDPRFPATRRHLRRLFVDPMTGKAQWGLVREGGRIVGVHSLSPLRPLARPGWVPGMDPGNGETYRDWKFIFQPAPLPSSPLQQGRP